jgi:hypothetical protein
MGRSLNRAAQNQRFALKCDPASNFVRQMVNSPIHHRYDHPLLQSVSRGSLPCKLYLCKYDVSPWEVLRCEPRELAILLCENYAEVVHETLAEILIWGAEE